MAVFFFLPLLGDQMRGDDLDTSPVPETSRLSAIVFDIGQGLSVVVEVGTYRLLYDTGPAYLSGSPGNNSEQPPSETNNTQERLLSFRPVEPDKNSKSTPPTLHFTPRLQDRSYSPLRSKEEKTCSI
jgi:hypothetical protein